MLKPFYQGKLDAFCAIYAVLNAYRLILGMRTSKAMSIFNETLMAASARRDVFDALLYQKTDYMHLVDWMFATQCKQLQLEVQKPFTGRPVPDREEFWQTCRNWLARKEGQKVGSAIVFRFIRYLAPDKAPLNKHWTTTCEISDDIVHLFDCSHEAEAILNVRKDSFVTRQENISRGQLLYIPPEYARFVRLNF